MKHKIAIIALTVAACACTTPQQYDAEGVFEADEITVSAEGTGEILWLNVEEGSDVKAGIDLGCIDTVQLQLQRLELAKQQSATLKSRPDIASQSLALRRQIAGVTVERDRVKRLLADSAATPKQLDDLNSRIATLEGQLTGLTSQLEKSSLSLNETASAVDIKIAAVLDKIAKCHITSPINGTVLCKYASTGEVAAFGTPLFKVADMNNVYLRAYFTSDQLADIKLGQKVTVVANYGGDNTKEYEGTITYIASESEFTPKTIQTRDSRANLVYAVKIAVNNDGYLKLGLSGNVIL